MNSIMYFYFVGSPGGLPHEVMKAITLAMHAF
jgi:hypothetical protein